MAPTVTVSKVSFHRSVPESAHMRHTENTLFIISFPDLNPCDDIHPEKL